MLASATSASRKWRPLDCTGRFAQQGMLALAQMMFFFFNPGVPVLEVIQGVWSIQPKFRPIWQGKVFFRNVSSWTKLTHWVLNRNFQTFWLNGSHRWKTITQHKITFIRTFTFLATFSNVKGLLSKFNFVLWVTYCFFMSCWLAHSQLFWNVLLFSCNPMGQLCLSGPSYSSCTVTTFSSESFRALD